MRNKMVKLRDQQRLVRYYEQFKKDLAVFNFPDAQTGRYTLEFHEKIL